MGSRDVILHSVCLHGLDASPHDFLIFFKAYTINLHTHLVVQKAFVHIYSLLLQNLFGCIHSLFKQVA